MVYLMCKPRRASNVASTRIIWCQFGITMDGHFSSYDSLLILPQPLSRM
jgi:hypothetical protein